MWNLSGHLQNLIIEKMSETVNASSKKFRKFYRRCCLNSGKETSLSLIHISEPTRH